MRAIAFVFLVMLASACTSTREVKASGNITLVDELGAPIPGAIVVPEEEDEGHPVPRFLATAESAGQTSDAQGMFHVGLDDFLWNDDGCYHFRVHKIGFGDVTMTVSKDLFPQVLRITLKSTPTDARHPPDPAQPGRQP